jgi:hypothetical protein
MQWVFAHWADILISLIAVERALERLFPDWGWLKTAETDTTAVANAVGVKPQ